jgi:hypothetical protein
VASAVTDDLCDAMAVIGNAETVRARVRAYAEQGIDVSVINPIADPAGAKRVIQTIAGSLDGLDCRQSGVMRATAGKR